MNSPVTYAGSFFGSPIEDEYEKESIVTKKVYRKAKPAP